MTTPLGALRDALGLGGKGVERYANEWSLYQARETLAYLEGAGYRLVPVKLVAALRALVDQIDVMQLPVKPYVDDARDALINLDADDAL